MAKKPVRRKTSASASSSKTVRSSSAKKSTRAKQTVRAKSKSKKKLSYKEQYIKLLEKTNKTLTRIADKATDKVEARQKIAIPPDFEAFPKEEGPSPVQARPYRTRTATPATIEEEILGKLTDIEMEIRARDSQFDDLVHGSPKLMGD